MLTTGFVSVDPVSVRICRLVSRQFQSRSAGCSGNTIGVSGTLNCRSTGRMCQSLRVSGRSVMDMGAGDGQFMISALANGARNVLGCEHPQNHAQLFIFRSVLEGMAQVLDGFEFDQIASKVEFMLHDIDQALTCAFLSSIQSTIRLSFDSFDNLFGQLRVMPGFPGTFPEAVYAFWVGMSLETQLAILELCALCPSVDTLAVFRCTNWTRHVDGNVTIMPAMLNATPNLRHNTMQFNA